MIVLPAQLAAALADGGTLLVPSRRHAHAVRMAVAATALAAGRRVWATPDVLPPDGWLRREYERAAACTGAMLRVLAPAEEWYLWRECTAADIEDPLLAPARLAGALQAAAMLDDEFGLAAHRVAPVSAEGALYARVRAAVQARARELGAVIGPGALAAALAARHGSALPQRTALCGFAVAPPLLAGLGIAAVSSSGELAQPAARLAADAGAELEQITAWCAQRLAAQPQARLLVVLPGSAAARERLAQRITQAVDARGWLAEDPAHPVVRLEGGEPLLDGPLAADALLALRFVCGAPLELAALGRFLRSPWRAGAASARAALELWLRAQGVVRMDHAAFLALLERPGAAHGGLAGELRRRHLAAAQCLGEGRRTPRDWSERFRDALEALGWPGPRSLASPEQQLLLRVHELLDEFGQLEAASGALARGDAVQLLGELAAGTRYRSADLDAPVTLGPELGDPLVRYDGIWVAGLTADVFPRRIDPDPFLPLSLQRARGVPAASAAGRMLEAQQLLGAWQRATSELVLSAARRDEDVELAPSPLLAPWLSAAHAPGSVRPWLALRLRRGVGLEPFEDEQGPPWDLTRDLPGGTRSLELQNDCPFRAYVELRLGSGELRESTPGVAPDLRGRLLHRLLQRLWSTLGSRAGLAGLSPGALAGLVQGLGREVLHELAGVDPQDAACPPTLRRELRRATERVLATCALELERPDFCVEDTERELMLTLAGARLTLRIDRIDRLPDDARVILDYKTGRRRAIDWYDARPSHPQLLAYLTALAQAQGAPVAAVATLTVNARELRYDGLGRASGLLPGVSAAQAVPGDAEGGAWAAWQVRWRARLTALAQDFSTGVARVDPRAGVCQYCHASAICRIPLPGAPLDAGEPAAQGEQSDV